MAVVCLSLACLTMYGFWASFLGLGWHGVAWRLAIEYPYIILNTLDTYDASCLVRMNP